MLHAVASALALDQNINDGHVEVRRCFPQEPTQLTSRQLIRWALEHGIDYSIRDEGGKTAEERLAEAKQHHEAAKALDIVKKWRVRVPYRRSIKY